MSDDNFDIFDDEVLINLEKLKAKYSDYGVDDEAIEKINKNIVRSNPNYNAFEEDFANGFPEEESATETPDNRAYVTEDTEPEEQKSDFDYEDDISDEIDDIYSSSDSPAAYNSLYNTDEDNNVYFSYPPEASQNNITYSDYAENDMESNKFESIEETDITKTKKKKKKKSHKLRNTLLILFIIAVLWGTFFAINMILTSDMKTPILCIKTDEYENGSVDYMGLFYKIQFHVDEGKDETSVHCMPWFVHGPNEGLQKKVKPSSAEETTLSAEEKARIAQDNLTTIEITIPKDYVELNPDGTLELSDGQKQQGFKSVALNGDGSATYKIGKGDYKVMLEDLKTTTGDNLNSIAVNDDYPSIQKIEFTDDFSVVTLYVNKEEYINGLDRFIDQQIYQWVGKYNAFAQNNGAKCGILLKDIADNSEFTV